MLQLTLPTTQLQVDLQSIEDSLVLITNRTLANVHELNGMLDRIWNLPDDRILTILNTLGPVQVQALFTAQTKYAEEFNGLLADRGITDVIAKSGQGRETIINDQGLFELVMPPTIEGFIPKEEMIIE
jgi:hypothetical protein